MVMMNVFGVFHRTLQQVVSTNTNTMLSISLTHKLLVVLMTLVLVSPPQVQGFGVCRSSFRCLNGGVERYGTSIFSPCRCQCQSGYTGPRCQYREALGKRSTSLNAINQVLHNRLQQERRQQDHLFDKRQQDIFDERQQDVFDERQQDVFDKRQQDIFDKRQQDVLDKSIQLFDERQPNIFDSREDIFDNGQNVFDRRQPQDDFDDRQQEEVYVNYNDDDDDYGDNYYDNDIPLLTRQASHRRMHPRFFRR